MSDWTAPLADVLSQFRGHSLRPREEIGAVARYERVLQELDPRSDVIAGYATKGGEHDQLKDLCNASDV